jgi:N-acetylmuramic acid 6-phosphate etherase
LGARTIYITCNPAMAGAGKAVADVLVSVDVGPEAIMGSTRMKSGTAEKMVLNMISTASMVRLGKVYGNLMVDLWATSEKLRHRSVRIVMLATRSSRAEALKLVKQAGGSVKVAVVMKLKGVGHVEARRVLAASDGFVRRAVERKPR